MDGPLGWLTHLVARASSELRQLPARSRVLYSTRPRQLGILTACAFLLVVWIDPRLYHSPAPRDILPLVPVPAPSSQLAQRLATLNATLDEHYRARGRTLPEQVFPYQALTRAQQSRYKLLSSRDGGGSGGGGGGIYLFATLIRQVQDQLPDLLAALVVVVDTLGADRVAFTFLEGPSDDLTSSVFTSVLEPLLHTLGVPSRRIRIITDSPPLDFSHANRIELLANLRNDALQPLWQDPSLAANVKSVLFFNDVYLKAEHMLELLYMHQLNGAGVTAAWDWYKRQPAYFYDVWIETGDLFYPIPHAWWSPSDELFPDAPVSRAAFAQLEPFQVFCGWNGMVVMDPAPFLPPHNVRFRRSDVARGECAASECGLVCADYWKAGFGKVQVVPSVQLAYERDVAIQTEYLMQQQRLELGWRDGTPPVRGGKLYKGLTWRTQPPERIRCNPWPEKDGLGHNVWEHTKWVPPWL
ncbi:hypothetical protein NliqN6_2078 [Naganishia liquefaciens]|uniref:Alpha-1,3-mannosyltransferase CMT1 n=1 Tax=Naganishia liquefaciens TaxID=104408 RepID=A0A8H3YFG9_9TREE|nr:hypothetical protein NliqN6_2078 [Naganishia liquefaciens]